MNVEQLAERTALTREEILAGVHQLIVMGLAELDQDEDGWRLRVSDDGLSVFYHLALLIASTLNTGPLAPVGAAGWVVIDAIDGLPGQDAQ